MYDVRPEPVAELAKGGREGVRVARRSRAAQRIHHHLVADEAQTQDVIFEADGILTTLKDEAVVIIGSTLGPAAVQALSGAIAARGGETLDAPISGGYLAAADGTLSMMIGGRQAILDRAMPVLAGDREQDHARRRRGRGAGREARASARLQPERDGAARRACAGRGRRRRARGAESIFGDGIANSAVLGLWPDLGPRWKAMLEATARAPRRRTCARTCISCWSSRASSA